MKDRLDEIYWDQQIRTTGAGHYTITSVYLPAGIKRLDYEFTQRIIGLTSKDEYDTLRKEIRKNPHLHHLIKENLLFNLKLRLKRLRRDVFGIHQHDVVLPKSPLKVKGSWWKPDQG